MKAIERNLQRILYPGKKDQELRQEHVLNLFYGKDGYIFQILHQLSGITYDRFSRFVIVLCYMSSIKGTVSKTYRIFPQLVEILVEKDFIDMCRSIDQFSSIDSRNDDSTSPEPFWKRLQKRFNEQIREICVVNRQFQRHVIDDDKVHFEHKQAEVSYKRTSIKFGKHQKDNRWGNVIHTAGLPYSQLISCVTYEENGDSTQTCVEKMLETMFQTSNTERRGRGVTLGIDRGYMTKDFVRYTLSSGFNIHGTVKRSGLVAFNYDQTQKATDERILLESKGVDSLYMAHGKFNSKSLANMAYRNGNGSMCMLLSSEIKDFVWDIVPYNKAHGMARKASVNSFVKDYCFTSTKIGDTEKTFKDIYFQIFEEMYHCDVQFVTSSQNGSEWHICRGFSITSKSSYSIISILHQTAKHQPKEIEEWAFLDEILSYAYKSFKRKDGHAYVENSQQSNTQGPTDCDEQSEATLVSNNHHEESLEAYPVGADDALKKDEDYIKAEDNDVDTTTLVKKRLEEVKNVDQVDLNLFLGSRNDVPYLQAVLKELGVEKVPKTRSTLMESLNKWASESKDKRPLVLLSKTQLCIMYERKFNRKPPSRLNSSMIIDHLTTQLSVTGTTTNTATTEPSLLEKIIDVLVGNIAMKQLSSKAADNCEIGHAMERVYAEKLIADPDLQKIDVDVKCTYSVGLVQRRSQQFVKASVDRLMGVYRPSNGDHELYLVEFNARVCDETQEKEHDIFKQYHDGEKYLVVDFDSDLSYHVIPDASERLQILHHCYTYSVNVIFFVVGDTRTIIRGVFVNFSNSILYAYEDLMEELYELALRPFYENTEWPFQFKRAVDQSISKHRSRLVDHHSFFQRLSVYKCLMDFIPLPKCKVIPLACSIWNAQKYLSDQATQMIWKNELYIPQSSPQLEATLRMMFFLPSYELHRILQMISCTKNYSSLLAYRNAANKRFSLETTIERLKTFMLCQLSNDDLIQLYGTSSLHASTKVDSETKTYGFDGKGRVVLCNFIVPFTDDTPQRDIDKFYGSDINQHNHVYNRKKDCDGCTPIMIVDKDGSRGSGRYCQYCKKKSRMLQFCPSCHHHFCSTQYQDADHVGEYLAIPINHTIYKATKGNEYLYALNTCYLKAHKAGLQTRFNIINPTVITPNDDTQRQVVNTKKLKKRQLDYVPQATQGLNTSKNDDFLSTSSTGTDRCYDQVPETKEESKEVEITSSPKSTADDNISKASSNRKATVDDNNNTHRFIFTSN